MQPIHDLLHRIRWDPTFQGHFEIAYLDHTQSDLIRIPFHDVRFDADDRAAITLRTAESEQVAIPLHRIRKVYRDGTPIWIRPESS
jgi:uncharacterized protein (UPF0248 family)